MLRVVLALTLGSLLMSSFSTQAAVRKIRMQGYNYKQAPKPAVREDSFSDYNTPYREESIFGDYRDVAAPSVSYKRVYVNRKDRPKHFGFPEERPATGNKVFIFSPKLLAWAAYGPDGKLVKVGYASGGKGYCADIGARCITPAGTYKVHRKHGPGYKSKTFPRRASGNHGGAPMAWAMFFHKGFAIHASHHVPDYNASHGCVRTVKADAEWLNKKFIEYGTTVIVDDYKGSMLKSQKKLAENKDT